MNLNSTSNIYFDQKDVWINGYSDNAAEQIRLKTLSDWIPGEVQTILDVGCGNGMLINYLNSLKRFNRIVGVDSSRGALDFVEVEKYISNAESLPFEDNTFDLVCCNEVLEHIKYPVFDDVLKELKRVTKKFLLITVPNNESIKSNLKVCPNCGCNFHPYYHLRSFNKKSLNNLYLNELKILRIDEIKTFEMFYYDIVLNIIKIFKSFNPQPLQICPQCGFYTKVNEKSVKTIKEPNPNFVYFIKYLLKKKKNKWLIALYLKNE